MNPCATAVRFRSAIRVVDLASVPSKHPASVPSGMVRFTSASPRRIGLLLSPRPRRLRLAIPGLDNHLLAVAPTIICRNGPADRRPPRPGILPQYPERRQAGPTGAERVRSVSRSPRIRQSHLGNPRFEGKPGPLVALPQYNISIKIYNRVQYLTNICSCTYSHRPPRDRWKTLPSIGYSRRVAPAVSWPAGGHTRDLVFGDLGVTVNPHASSSYVPPARSSASDSPATTH